MAVSPDGTRAYVANKRLGSVSVINTATNHVTATIAVGGNPDEVAVSPDGTRAYVTNGGSRHRVGDQRRDQPGHRHHRRRRPPARGGGLPRRHPRLRHQRGSGSVSVINTATNHVTGTILVGSFP